MSYYVMCKTDGSSWDTGVRGTGEQAYTLGEGELVTSQSIPDFETAERYANQFPPRRDARILMEVFALQPELDDGNPKFEMEFVSEDEE